MSTDQDALRRLALADQIELVRLLEEWKATLPRACNVASGTVSRADTTPKELFSVPAGYEAHLIVIHGDVGSDAGTTAELDVGIAGGNQAAIVPNLDVRGAAGVGQQTPKARKLGVVSQQTITVTATYAETGTPSTTGGPWTVNVFYSKAGS